MARLRDRASPRPDAVGIALSSVRGPMGFDQDDSEPRLLFAYGTLGPAVPDSGVPEGWMADAVRGALYDLGPYPILVGWDDPGSGWVEGHVRPVDRDELERVLDPYEGVDEGLYARIALRTRAGRRAWTYVFPHPVPDRARGPLLRWAGPRVNPGSPPVTNTIEGAR